MENKDDEFTFTSSNGDIVINIDSNYPVQDTITITNMSECMNTISLPPLTSDQVVYTLSGSDTINLDGLSSSTFVFDKTEWKDCFPDFTTVEKMCDEYPGLAKAFENFKTVYKMVEQDWKGKMKDDQAPLF